MKKLIATVALSLSAFACFAQKSFLFKPVYQANKTYKSDCKILAKMKMTMLDSLGHVDTTKAGFNDGIMDMGMKMNMGSTMKMGERLSDKKTPFKLAYDKMEYQMEVGGQTQTVPMPDFKAMTMTGKISENNEFEIDTLSGIKNTMNQEMAKKMLQQLQMIKFPERPIKVGDTFSVDMNIDAPMDVTKMGMKFKMTYKLKEIKENKGYFDYTALMDMGLQKENNPAMAMTGEGMGTAIYDLDKQFLSKQTGNMKMKMDMNIPNAHMKMDMDMNTDMDIVVE